MPILISTTMALPAVTIGSFSYAMPLDDLIAKLPGHKKVPLSTIHDERNTALVDWLIVETQFVSA